MTEIEKKAGTEKTSEVEILKWEQKQILEDNEYYQKINNELREKIKAAENRADTAEKKLEKAEATMQQMRCCYNCDHQQEAKRCKECWNFDKWELRK